jgi:hypothetical protein
MVIDRTIADLSGHEPISDEDFFVGLAEAKDRLREDLLAQYGDRVNTHIASAELATSGWTRKDHENAAEQGRRLFARMAQARERGVAPDDREALDLMAEHYQAIRAMWPADAAAYHALGDLILNNPEQHAIVASVDPQLPPWLAKAIQAYAVHRLGHTKAGPRRE